MQITNLSTNDAVLAELGVRLARLRIERALTQRQLAVEAGVGVATVKRLEAGSAVGSDTLVRVLRAVGRLGAIEQLVPEAPPRPIEQLAHGGDRRRRVRHGQAAEGGDDAWHWLDDGAHGAGPR